MSLIDLSTSLQIEKSFERDRLKFNKKSTCHEMLYSKKKKGGGGGRKTFIYLFFVLFLIFDQTTLLFFRCVI